MEQVAHGRPLEGHIKLRHNLGLIVQSCFKEYSSIIHADFRFLTQLLQPEERGVSLQRVKTCLDGRDSTGANGTCTLFSSVADGDFCLSLRIT